jgi:hypothetical protein
VAGVGGIRAATGVVAGARPAPVPRRGTGSAACGHPDQGNATDAAATSPQDAEYNGFEPVYGGSEPADEVIDGLADATGRAVDPCNGRRGPAAGSGWACIPEGNGPSLTRAWKNSGNAVADSQPKTSKRVLDPSERISEVLFGLIMVLTFTCSLGAAEAGRDDVRTMLIGALGCNLAWGIIDGILYVLSSLAARGHNLQVYLAVRGATDAGKARELIAGALPPVVASILQPAELESIHARLLKLPDPPKRARTRREDWLGALGVFLLVFLSTFPVALPFVFLENATRALRVSNAVAMFMLFILGHAYGRHIGRSAWGFGLTMVALGAVLVLLAIALGG